MARKATPKTQDGGFNSGGYSNGGAMLPVPNLSGGGGGGGGGGAPAPDYNPYKCFIGGVSHQVDDEMFKVRDACKRLL